ncbi:nitronate monooxygenase [Breoghania sp. JC706]|uniref:NAD(P)H-dependent flavin oxidoreductase n=1 Tax=Breoghania sp. JC706 TaxID=3117732 RepID=UPI00300A7067
MRRFKTRITDLLNIDHPIVLAPMGGISGGTLAASVSRAGGLGLVGASYGERAWMESELAKLGAPGAPWGIGLVMFTVAERMDLLDLALSHAPDVIALSFGDPAPFLPRIHAAGAKAIVQVHELDQARAAADLGADALIVQGAEAGGHSRQRSTFPLLPAVRDLVGEDMPLIAAGGIGDGRGVAAALALGADAAMLGTRFVACDESLASGRHKQRLVAAGAAETVRTRAFDIVRGIAWPEPYSGRAIANGFSRRWAEREGELAGAPANVRAHYAEALAADDLDFRAMWAGEVLDIVRDIRPARRIVEELVADALDTISGFERLLAPQSHDARQRESAA